MPALEIKLPHNYKRRDYQKDAWDAFHGVGIHKDKNYRIFVFDWHRRAGEDLTNWNMAIERTAEMPMTTKYAIPLT